MKPILLAVCRCIKLEKSEFNRAFCEGCVVVQHVVAAIVIMVGSAPGCIVALVPDVCEGCHRGGLLAIYFGKEAGINRSAIGYLQPSCRERLKLRKKHKKRTETLIFLYQNLRPFMVPEAGLEPARYFYRGILSPLK